MKIKQALPPVCFFAALVLIVALHFACPGRRLIAKPWNYLGIFPMLAGLLVSGWASRLFKEAATTIKPFVQSSCLITEGPYRFSRHPIYAGMALFLIGVAVLLGTVTPMPVVLAFILAADKVFIRGEERAMEQTFGDAYVEYRKRVRRWI